MKYSLQHITKFPHTAWQAGARWNAYYYVPEHKIYLCCPCERKDQVCVPIRPPHTDPQFSWELHEHPGGTFTLKGSIQLPPALGFPCKCHFYIVRSEVCRKQDGSEKGLI